jgi:Aldo/keto reductases, related to diketogulonate reductase
MTSIPSYELNDGTTLPAIGFGTYPLKGDEAVDAVSTAIGIGYRLIDTAVNYSNEDTVGRGVTASGVPRDELQVTTKLPGRDHGYDETLASFELSRAALGVDYVDLYLIHWPNPSVGRYVDTWRAMIELRDRGLVRSIGVSNFTEEFLERLREETGVLPSVNQVELHPYFPQVELRAFHQANGIRTEAWSPLGKNAPVLDEPVIAAAADRHGVTPAQAVLRWHVQLGSVPIPKSKTPVRQRENLDVFGFELSDDEVAAITALGRPDGRLFGGDPNTHEEM